MGGGAGRGWRLRGVSRENKNPTLDVGNKHIRHTTAGVKPMKNDDRPDDSEPCKAGGITAWVRDPCREHQDIMGRRSHTQPATTTMEHR
eukprot:967577-Pyramimonas_sp.AAC.1